MASHGVYRVRFTKMSKPTLAVARSINRLIDVVDALLGKPRRIRTASMINEPA